jgi:uncharacterized protein YciI
MFPTRRSLACGAALASLCASPTLLAQGASSPSAPAAAPSAASAAGAARPARDVRWVVLHSPGPQWQPGKNLFEQPGVREHVEHYRKLLVAGKLALGGPHLDERGGGMMIPAAGVSEAEIRQFAADDPAVKSGLLRFDVRPWFVGMAR